MRAAQRRSARFSVKNRRFEAPSRLAWAGAPRPEPLHRRAPGTSAAVRLTTPFPSRIPGRGGQGGPRADRWQGWRGRMTCRGEDSLYECYSPRNLAAEGCIATLHSLRRRLQKLQRRRQRRRRTGEAKGGGRGGGTEGAGKSSCSTETACQACPPRVPSALWDRKLAGETECAKFWISAFLGLGALRGAVARLLGPRPSKDSKERRRSTWPA